MRYYNDDDYLEQEDYSGAPDMDLDHRYDFKPNYDEPQMDPIDTNKQIETQELVYPQDYDIMNDQIYNGNSQPLILSYMNNDDNNGLPLRSQLQEPQIHELHFPLDFRTHQTSVESPNFIKEGSIDEINFTSNYDHMLYKDPSLTFSEQEQQEQGYLRSDQYDIHPDNNHNEINPPLQPQQEKEQIQINRSQPNKIEKKNPENSVTKNFVTNTIRLFSDHYKDGEKSRQYTNLQKYKKYFRNESRRKQLMKYLWGKHYIIDLMSSVKLKKRRHNIRYVNNILSVAYDRRSAWKNTARDVKVPLDASDK